MQTLPFRIRNERQFRALTGLPRRVFDILLPEFIRCLDLSRQQRDRQRQVSRRRKPGGGRKGALSTPEQKLFFILFYLKNYPTFDVMGALFDLSPGKANANVKKLLPVLRKAQHRLHVLPHRHFKTPDDTRQHAEKPKKIIIDATERPICRPHHAGMQKRYYSGKKRRHTLKNTVITEAAEGILVIGPTSPGRRHDYALLKDELDPNQPGLAEIEVWVDLGYQGIKELYPVFKDVHIPHKKPRKSPRHPNPTLTPQQKKENRRKIG